MNIKALQTESGKFTIAAFDQRGSLAKLLGVDHESIPGIQTLQEMKSTFMEAFSPISSAVLVDPDFGLPSLEKKSSEAGLLMSLEKSSYTIEDKEAVPLLNPNWGVKEIVAKNAAVKFVLFYHPKSENAEKKRKLVNDIHLECRNLEVPFLFEVILHPLKAETPEEFASNHPQLQLETIESFTHSCDVLKLEFPILTSEDLDVSKASEACRTITNASTVPWVILSKGMGYERYIRSLEFAMQNGASGFAVGRAVWKEIGDLPSREEQYVFIQTTATERMQRLIEIVEAA